MELAALSRASSYFQGGEQQPDTLWTDRGKGFYSPHNGVIAVGYKDALREHHFKAALGDVNATCDVEALRRGFMKRIDQLVDQKGGRLAR